MQVFTGGGDLGVQDRAFLAVALWCLPHPTRKALADGAPARELVVA